MIMGADVSHAAPESKVLVLDHDLQGHREIFYLSL